ncbi:MAG: hypothetical protein WCC12_22195 [Anaerolineales bacterium]
MYRLKYNQDVIELLEKLKGLRMEYPVDLLSARRDLFIKLVTQYIAALM